VHCGVAADRCDAGAANGMNALCTVLSAGLLTATPAWAAPPTPVEYTIILREPQTQMVDVSMSIRGLAADQTALEIDLPVWRPGKYAVLDPAGGVREVRARSGQGKTLAIEKVEKSQWMVTTGAATGDDEVIIDYRVYANSLGDRTRHVDDTHAFLDPAAVLMYAPEFRDQPARIRIEAPEGWQTATGLDPDPADPATLLAPSYDVLADSPLEIGVHSTIDFEVDGVPHQVVVWNGRKDVPAGLGPEFSKDKLVEPVTKMIRAERDIFGEFPYHRYVFLVHCIPGGGGGTEHLNSTIMQVGAATFADEAGLKRFLGLASHEFFHTWNVKQLRPAGLKPVHGGYDFQRENYTDLLWVAEGTTSYLDAVCLVRAGVTKPDEYVKGLGGAIDSLRNRPGASVQSLAESSFDAWIKFNHDTPDSVNSTVSFYGKGALVSLLLDLELRTRSDSRASLDTVLREMYRSFPLDGPGYTEEDLIRACERQAGSSFRQFFADYVDGVKWLDFETTLAAAGLEVKHEATKAEGARRGVARSDEAKDDSGERPDADDTTTTTQPKERTYIGINVEAKDGLASVSSVLTDGPAYKAGVLPGDLIVAVNGERVKGTDLDSILKRIKLGETVKLTLFRYDRLREIEFKADSRAEGKWSVTRVKNPTEQQKAVYEAWLGQPWPGDKKAESSDK
jgi:predicted metalloprotease with PDZ domain